MKLELDAKQMQALIDRFAKEVSHVELSVDEMAKTFGGKHGFATTMAVGEEDVATTMAVGEEVDCAYTTMAIGEEDGGATTMAIGEE